MHISSRIQSVPASGIRKFFDVVSQMEGVISLGVGEPDFVTPRIIRDACINALEKGYTTYTSNYGLAELRRLVSDHIHQDNGVTYDPASQVLITVGASEAIDVAMHAILEVGDEVIIPEPCFVSYKPCVIFAGGVPVPIATSAENEFVADPADIEAAVTPRTRAIFISYPSNPTGTVMPKEKMQAVVDIARKHDLYIISDEIYDKLVYGVKHVCVPAMDGAYERTIYINGFSKAYAMTGWRIGYVCTNPELLEAMMKVHQYIIMCAPIMAQMAAMAALRNGKHDMESMVREYDHRRRLIVDSLNRIGLDCFEPKGAFYVFPSIKRTGLTSDEFAERLLFEENVAVVPGNAFGACGEGYVRCSYATSIENIQEAMSRTAAFVNRIAASR
jgi:aminotransferase